LRGDSAVLTVVSFAGNDVDAASVTASQHCYSGICYGISGSLNQNLVGLWGVSINVVHFCWSYDG
jgi:hypothetical protein